MEVAEPEKGGKVRESFKFVSEEVKRDVWKDGRDERSEPTCTLSARNISYTVR